MTEKAKNFIQITENCNSPMIIEDGIRNLSPSVRNELIRYYSQKTNGAVNDVKSLALTMASIKF